MKATNYIIKHSNSTELPPKSILSHLNSEAATIFKTTKPKVKKFVKNLTCMEWNSLLFDREGVL